MPIASCDNQSADHEKRALGDSCKNLVTTRQIAESVELSTSSAAASSVEGVPALYQTQLLPSTAFKIIIVHDQEQVPKE
jgi:hypothetical protein